MTDRAKASARCPTAVPPRSPTATATTSGGGRSTIATIDELLDKVDSKYTLVHLAAQRAREINDYYHSLGEGLGQYTPPLVEQVSSNKPLSIALEEIAAKKIVVQYPGDAQRAAAELLRQEEEDADAEILELSADDLYDDEPTPPEPE